MLEKFANSYRTRKDSLLGSVIFRNPDYRDRTFEFASGGIYSTADDLYIFLKAVQKNTLLGKEHTSLLFKENKDSYGYGWWISDPRYLRYGPKVNMLSHSGAVEGFRANVAIVDYGNWTIVLLSNVAPLATRKLTYDIVQIIKGM